MNKLIHLLFSSLLTIWLGLLASALKLSHLNPSKSPLTDADRGELKKMFTSICHNPKLVDSLAKKGATGLESLLGEYNGLKEVEKVKISGQGKGKIEEAIGNCDRMKRGDAKGMVGCKVVWTMAYWAAHTTNFVTNMEKKFKECYRHLRQKDWYGLNYSLGVASLHFRYEHLPESFHGRSDEEEIDREDEEDQKAAGK